ncbi:MAG: iron-containing redox enzyme family protein [Kofleriaceae bacterium]
MNIEALSRKLQQVVTGHEAMGVLEATFGERLKRAPLARDTLQWFLACHVASVRSVPTSILTLSTRISSELLPHDYFNAHAVAARTLFAAAHEYGLANTEQGITQTHFQLYRDGLRSWGFDENEILADRRVFPECAEINAFTDDVAAHWPVAKALACHFALEEVADREFVLLWEGFAQHWQAYGLTGTDDPALSFYQIHTVQEPLHGEYGLEALRMYLQHVPTDESLLVDGVAEWMAIYLRWLKAFERAFFS